VLVDGAVDKQLKTTQKGKPAEQDNLRYYMQMRQNMSAYWESWVAIS